MKIVTANFDLRGTSADYNKLVITVTNTSGETPDDICDVYIKLENGYIIKDFGATADIASTWTQASRIIKTSLPPDLNGVAVRLLFERVELEKQSLEEQGQTITRQIERNLWTKYAPKVVLEVQNTRRSEVMTQVREVLSKPEEINREESQDKTVGRFTVKVVE